MNFESSYTVPFVKIQQSQYKSGCTRLESDMIPSQDSVDTLHDRRKAQTLVQQTLQNSQQKVTS